MLNAGAVGSDVLEAQVAAELLRRYNDDALVPVGMRWARTPERVQVAARENQQLDDPTVEAAHKPSSRKLESSHGWGRALCYAECVRKRSGGGSPQRAG